MKSLITADEAFLCSYPCVYVELTLSDFSSSQMEIMIGRMVFKKKL
jgi:hypothetical protein